MTFLFVQPGTSAVLPQADVKRALPVTLPWSGINSLMPRMLTMVAPEERMLSVGVPPEDGLPGEEKEGTGCVSGEASR